MPVLVISATNIARIGLRDRSCRIVGRRSRSLAEQRGYTYFDRAGNAVTADDVKAAI